MASVCVVENNEINTNPENRSQFARIRYLGQNSPNYMKASSILSIIGKVLLTLLLVSPILGSLGIFPAPTADMYGTPQAFQFVDLLMKSKYIMIIDSLVFLAAIVCLWTKRTALAALLILPITINIIGFHAFLDSGLFTAGAIMGDVLFLLNLAFLWQQRAQYRSLFQKHS